MWLPLGSAPSSHLRLLPQSVTNGCGHCRAVGCKRRPHVFYGARAAQPAGHGPRSSPSGIEAEKSNNLTSEWEARCLALWIPARLALASAWLQVSSTYPSFQTSDERLNGPRDDSGAVFSCRGTDWGARWAGRAILEKRALRQQSGHCHVLPPSEKPRSPRWHAITRRFADSRILGGNGPPRHHQAT